MSRNSFNVIQRIYKVNQMEFFNYKFMQKYSTLISYISSTILILPA